MPQPAFKGGDLARFGRVCKATSGLAFDVLWRSVEFYVIANLLSLCVDYTDTPGNPVRSFSFVFDSRPKLNLNCNTDPQAQIYVG
jgi:hypothetical protein